MHRIVATTPLFLLFVIQSCGDLVESEEAIPQQILGTPLTTVQTAGTYQWWWPLFAWTPDGTEIVHRPFIRTTPGPQLLVVNTSNRSTRLIVDVAYGELEVFKVPEEDDAVYYSASTYQGSVGAICRVASSGATEDVLVDTAVTSFDVSPDGSFLAYAIREDSLYLLDVTARTTRAIEHDAGYVVGVSPDGNAVLHGSFPREELQLSTLDDHTTRTIWSEEQFERSLLGHRWEQGELQFLYFESGDLYVRNVLAGVTHRVATTGGTPATAAWSSNGRLIAVWVSGECLRSQWTCQLRQYTLQLIDLVSGSVSQIGQGNFNVGDYEEPTDLRFSPDGSRVAYVHQRTGTSGSVLYVMDLP
jgi:Tol biopolymer transport system component